MVYMPKILSLYAKNIKKEFTGVLPLFVNMPGKKLLHLLKRLQLERHPDKREKIIGYGRQALIKWLRTGAHHLLKGVILVSLSDQ